MESRATLMTDTRLDAAIEALRFARTQQGIKTMRWAIDNALGLLDGTDGQEHSQDGAHAERS